MSIQDWVTLRDKAWRKYYEAHAAGDVAVKEFHKSMALIAEDKINQHVTRNVTGDRS